MTACNDYRQTQTNKDKDRHGQIETNRETETDKGKETQTPTERDRQGQTEMDGDRQTLTMTDKDKDKPGQRERQAEGASARILACAITSGDVRAGPLEATNNSDIFGPVALREQKARISRAELTCPKVQPSPSFLECWKVSLIMAPGSGLGARSERGPFARQREGQGLNGVASAAPSQGQYRFPGSRRTFAG